MDISRMVTIIMIAFILDFIIGEPQNPFHPIRMIGHGIALGIRIYKNNTPKSSVMKFFTGMLLSLVILFFSFTLTWLLTLSFYALNHWLGLFIEAVICYFLIAPKGMKTESMKVYASLKSGDLESARKNLAYLVSRDTKNLSQSEIIKATVETTSENLTDGVIAPLIFILIGGAPLGMAYRAVNTLDSMIGHRSDDFEYFGKFAARLDDLVNFIPARISALLMILGSIIVRTDTKTAIRIYLRDRRNHKSPNSAQTESVCAGALGILLGGDSYYQGLLVHHPTIGDPIQEPTVEHIRYANRLMYGTTILSIFIIILGSLLYSLLSKGNFYV